MSLRTRFTLLITLLVTVAVATAGLAYLNKYAGYAVQTVVERGNATAQLVKIEVLSRASARLQSMPDPPLSLDDRAAVWQTAIEEDIELPGILTQLMAPVRGLVEISIAGAGGRIICSNSPARRGQVMLGRPPISSLAQMNMLEKAFAIFRGDIDYESTLDLGVQGQKRVFRIQVLASPALLRSMVANEIRTTAWILFFAVLLSTVLAFFSAQVAYRPLARLGMAIDRIASGQTDGVEDMDSISSASEFAIVQQKLRLLGEQFRGAQQGQTQLRDSVQQILDRVESATLLFTRDGRLMVWGPVAERMLTRSPAELSGRTFDEVFPALAGHPFSSPLRGHAIGDLLLDLDTTPNGGALVRLSDPSGREMLENQLNLSSRLSAISRLTSGVAHEIKNPLNSISLHLELLRSAVPEDLPSATAPLGVIAEEIARLDRVVRTFLDFTRPVELETSPLDLREIVRGVAALIAPEAQAKGVFVECRLPESAVTVRGDANLLKQAVMNVVSNALDAMPGGGRLTFAMETSGAGAALEVQDTGRGIPKEYRERIFQLYFTTKQKGTGIGLAMTFRAVQLHGGSMDVESEPGQGTTMRILLPLLARQEVLV